jgi:hypothetical protein
VRNGPPVYGVTGTRAPGGGCAARSSLRAGGLSRFRRWFGRRPGRGGRRRGRGRCRGRLWGGDGGRRSSRDGSRRWRLDRCGRRDGGRRCSRDGSRRWRLDRCGRRGSHRSRLGGCSGRAHCGDQFVPISVLAAQRVLEVTQSSPQRPTRLGKPLRTEHQQRDHEDEQQVRWLKDVADQGYEVRARMVLSPRLCSRGGRVWITGCLWLEHESARVGVLRAACECVALDRVRMCSAGMTHDRRIDGPRVIRA